MRSIFILALVLLATPVIAREAGGRCVAGEKLPPGFTCFDREVHDCRPSNPSAGGGRIGYVACGEYRLRRLERQMQTLYKELLDQVSRPSEGRDARRARDALQKSQAAWARSTAADCEFVDALPGTGNASAGIAVDCYAEHVRARIALLKRLKGYV